MVLAIHRHANRLAENPMVWQWLGPHGVHFKPRGLHSSRRLNHGPVLEYSGSNFKRAKHCKKGCANVEIALHGFDPPRGASASIHYSVQEGSLGRHAFGQCLPEGGDETTKPG